MDYAGDTGYADFSGNAGFIKATLLTARSLSRHPDRTLVATVRGAIR
jgi:hypothetical protein